MSAACVAVAVALVCCRCYRIICVFLLLPACLLACMLVSAACVAVAVALGMHIVCSMCCVCLACMCMVNSFSFLSCLHMHDEFIQFFVICINSLGLNSIACAVAVAIKPAVFFAAASPLLSCCAGCAQFGFQL